jgi:hypothetical protein
MMILDTTHPLAINREVVCAQMDEDMVLMAPHDGVYHWSLDVVGSKTAYTLDETDARAFVMMMFEQDFIHVCTSEYA